MSWTNRFEGLSNLDAAVHAELVEHSAVVSVPKNTVIFGPGKAPDNLLLLLNGCVRVQQISEKGREIVLYRVHAGESCVLTTACVLAHKEYSAQGIAETDVEAVAIPRAVFDNLAGESKDFRHFVFSAYSKRITDLFMIIEEVAFQRMDIRLAHKLLELSQNKPLVKSTHQQLAAELGTAREVVSRQLQEFQRRNWISQSRGVIELLDVENLKLLASA